MLKPRDAKAALARQLVKRLHGDDSAEKLRRVDAALEKPLGARSLVPTLHRLLAMDAQACA